MTSGAKQIYKLQSLLTRSHTDVPKGHFVVYVGEREKKRYMVPITYLDHPSFQNLLRKAEEEFGFHHPMGGLTIPCNEDAFVYNEEDRAVICSSEAKYIDSLHIVNRRMESQLDSSDLKPLRNELITFQM
uniref:Auxin-responsive protein SAUR21-like n=1 Tax=Nicotiana tabacum TaxID=4097 RepID=A0A1S3Y7C3_TOBAC